MKIQDSFTWLKQSLVGANSAEEQFTYNGILWGVYEAIQGSENQDYGAIQSQTDATITLNQWPNVSAKDRLIHREFGETYLVTGVHRDRNTTVCQVMKYEELDLDHVLTGGSFSNDFSTSYDIGG